MIEVLTGSNELGMQTRLREIVAAFSQEHAGSIERFDGAELSSVDDVLDAVRSISFLDPKKLVIIRSPSASKELLEKLETIVTSTADSTDLVLVGQLDKRSKVFTFLKKHTNVQIFDDLQPAELKNWAVAYAREQGQTLASDVAWYLIEQVGTNQYRLRQELDKLMIHSDSVTRDDIDALVEPVPQSKVFALLDAMFTGQAKLAWRLYTDQRAQGEEPYKIVSMITWQLQQLTYAVFSPTPSKDALVQAGVSPYTAQKSMQMARRLTPQKLRYYIDQLATIDYQSKTSAAIESALEVYIADVATKQAAI